MASRFHPGETTARRRSGVDEHAGDGERRGLDGVKVVGELLPPHELAAAVAPAVAEDPLTSGLRSGEQLLSPEEAVKANYFIALSPGLSVAPFC